MANLFNHKTEQSHSQHSAQPPLADRMRPCNWTEFVGQEHLIAPGQILRRALDAGQIPSMILWGPPGSGKTTLARIMVYMTDARFVTLSATESGVKEVRVAVAAAKAAQPQRTILFIDEVHRFNKTQQDTLLPQVENGTVILIGSTTENPSFSVNAALLSRCRVFVLQLLSVSEVTRIIKNALSDRERGLGALPIKMSDGAVEFLAQLSNGDARTALNALELAVNATTRVDDGGKTIEIKEAQLKEALQKTHLLYDRAGEEHYNIISALHKSMRGSDADAALYWLGRMLEAGEDPLYVGRRLIRFASEDVGMANSLALPQVVAAYEACHYIGMPECGVNLAQAVVYLAKCKKSNKLYTAYAHVQEDIRNLPNEPVPLHLRNAPTKLMKNLGYGRGYKYTPDYENPKEAEQDYLPENLCGRKYLEE